MRFAVTLLLFLSAAEVNADENGCCRWGDNRACGTSDCWAQKSFCPDNWKEGNVDCGNSGPKLENPGGCCRVITDVNPQCVAGSDCWIPTTESTCSGFFKWVPDNNLDCESLPGWSSRNTGSTATTAKTAAAAAITVIAGGIVTFLM
mmetsp:Transcript_17669/g.21169  ORF Transcript_17669/g.21169 Transcript_17669/m.21169 type:complete len:147 (+) Transcript_17669:52-492(+)